MNILNDNIVSLLKGDKGDGLEIKKYYDSVEDMNADYSNADIAVGDTVAIKNTLALYEKGATAFESVGSLKGEKGADGTDGKNGLILKTALVTATAPTVNGTEGWSGTVSTAFNYEANIGDTAIVIVQGVSDIAGKSWITTAEIMEKMGGYVRFKFLSVTETTGAKGDTGDAAASWEKVTFTSTTPTTTIETSGGVKQLKIRVSGEDIPHEGDDCAVLSEEIVLYLYPDGATSEETMKALVLSVYNGAASMAYAHGFEYFTNDVVTYDCSSLGMVTSEFTGRQFVLKDISGATYPDGLSIASLPDSAAVHAMYAVEALKKAAAS